MNDGIKVDQSIFGKYGVYVMQDDLLFQWFTVRECLLFAARLRLGGLTIDQQNTRVQEIAIDLGLDKCLDTMVGS